MVTHNMNKNDCITAQDKVLLHMVCKVVLHMISKVILNPSSFRGREKTTDKIGKTHFFSILLWLLYSLQI